MIDDYNFLNKYYKLNNNRYSRERKTVRLNKQMHEGYSRTDLSVSMYFYYTKDSKLSPFKPIRSK